MIRTPEGVPFQATGFGPWTFSSPFAFLHVASIWMSPNDEIWTFVQDGGHEDFRRVAVVNPAEHPALQSVLEQIAAGRDMPR